MPNSKGGMGLISGEKFGIKETLEVTQAKLVGPNTWHATVQPFAG
jgi:hypothetical protein